MSDGTGPSTGYVGLLKVGDLVRCYWAGVWKIVEIQHDPYTTGTRTRTDHYLAVVEPILTGKFTLPKSKKTKRCDVSWCKIVTKEKLAEELAELVNTYTRAARILFGEE